MNDEVDVVCFINVSLDDQWIDWYVLRGREGTAFALVARGRGWLDSVEAQRGFALAFREQYQWR